MDIREIVVSEAKLNLPTIAKLNKRIYIAGPYSSDPEANTEKAIFFGDWVAALGYIPYIPHLTHYWEKLHHHDYEFWMTQDFEWLSLCHAVLRLPGESSGADREVKYALEVLSLPVFYSVPELMNFK